MPNNISTKLKSNATKPQFKPPTTTRTNAVHSSGDIFGFATIHHLMAVYSQNYYKVFSTGFCQTQTLINTYLAETHCAEVAKW